MVSDVIEKGILSEKPEDNRIAVEWGQKQEKLIKKGEEITQELIRKYTPIILARDLQEYSGNKSSQNVF